MPLIIYDPSEAANATRGTVCDELVESIDLAATFVDYCGGTVPGHIIEGRSLMPFLKGEAPEWREFVISEFDYSMTGAATKLGVTPRDARLFMVADKQWKFMHAEGGFRPMLFNMDDDPFELNDLGADEAFAEVIDLMYARLAKWARRSSQRTTISDEMILSRRGKSRERGILLGLYDGSEVEDRLLANIRRRVDQDFTGKDAQ